MPNFSQRHPSTGALNKKTPLFGRNGAIPCISQHRERDAAVGFSGTVDRRDAAVAAALAGAVVVIVGYAAGLGIKSSEAVAAQPPVAPSAPAAPVPEQAPEAGAPPAAPAPVPVAPMPPMAPMPVAPPVSPVPSAPSHPANPAQPSSPAGPDSPHSPHPPEPTPDDPAPSCAPGVLEGVPVVEPVTEAATTFLSAILGAVPVVDELAGGLIDCTVGTLVGPSCCSSEALLDEGSESER